MIVRTHLASLWMARAVSILARSMLAPSILAGSVLAGPLAALELTLPSSARQTAGEQLGLVSYALPIGPYADGRLPVRAFEGYVTRQAWRIEGAGVTPLQVLRPLRERLAEDGFDMVLDCAARDCGGFDFRFGTEVITPPAMLVDLDEYRFLSALKGPEDAPTEAASLLVSRSAETIYLQVIRVSVDKSATIDVARGAAIEASRETPVPQGQPVDETAASTLPEVLKQLSTRGHVVLSDLVFQTGSADLGSASFDSLAILAGFLNEDDSRRIALVGHTDATGGLDGNVALSKRRAASVKLRLQDAHNVPAAQLVAEGVGFLSPIATNATDAGRTANRRVEAVLIAGD